MGRQKTNVPHYLRGFVSSWESYVAQFDYMVKLVSEMTPGDSLTVLPEILQELAPGFEYNGAIFTPADRILENVIGSAYTHSYFYDYMSGRVTFTRHKNTGEIRYESPDRREARNDTVGRG